MRFRDAMDLVPDDLPDGAYWAMAHEMAGLEYGDGFDELLAEVDKPFTCGNCGKRFATKGAKRQHRRAKHGKPQP